MGEKRDFDDLPLKNGDFLYRTVSLPEGSEKNDAQSSFSASGMALL
jgi:hypothetical protein